MKKAHWLIRDITNDKCYFVMIHPELLVYVSQVDAIKMNCPINVDHAFVIETASKPANKMLVNM